jgi:hypothetical protein
MASATPGCGATAVERGGSAPGFSIDGGSSISRSGKASQADGVAAARSW